MLNRAIFANTPFQKTLLGNFLITDDWAATLNSKLLLMQSREILSENFKLTLGMGAFILLTKLKPFLRPWL